jgi:hypothetical protein
MDSSCKCRVRDAVAGSVAMGRERDDMVSEALESECPVTRRAAGFEEHRGGLLVGEVAEEAAGHDDAASCGGSPLHQMQPMSLAVTSTAGTASPLAHAPPWTPEPDTRSVGLTRRIR